MGSQVAGRHDVELLEHARNCCAHIRDVTAVQGAVIRGLVGSAFSSDAFANDVAGDLDWTEEQAKTRTETSGSGASS